MNLLLNILWIVLGGFLVTFFYFTGGIALCLTIVGIPWGIQCFKLGIFALFPFGSETQFRPQSDTQTMLNLILNVVWLVFGGIQAVLTHLVLGVLLCVTIIGIPFGLQHFKMVKLSIMPFGREIVDMHRRYQTN